ncbi:MAG: ABC transporter substrate-binding protein [Deltaproteobacteria bacterium]|nr:ABC transporter substrate-binding protein [Deltaproteobacteria bacterium]
MLVSCRKIGAAALAFFSLAGLIALSPPSAEALDRLKVGYLPVTGHAKFFVAKEQGFFAKEGLDVELVEFINSADGINAVRAGKLDIGAFGTTAPLVHISQGADLRIIGGIMGEDAGVITTAANAASLKSVNDLKGKKVATVRLASGDAVLRGALYKAGISWKSDLQIFELKNPPAVIEAVKTGQVDAGVIWGPFDITAEKEGLKVVLRSHDLSPGHPCCRIVATTDTVKRSPEVLTRFLRAILQAEKFTGQNKEATVAAIAKYVKIDRAVIEKAFYHGHLDQSSDPNVDEVKKFWVTMQKSEFITSQQDIVPYIHTGIYKAALDGLAKESPKETFWKDRQKVFAKRNAS